jgi:hypothetical protein
MRALGALFGISAAFTLLVIFQGYPTIKLLCNALCVVSCSSVTLSLFSLAVRACSILKIRQPSSKICFENKTAIFKNLF